MTACAAFVHVVVPIPFLMKENHMPTFMTNFVYTGESWQKLAKKPEDRSVPVKALMEKLGGRLISMYYMAGDYD